VARILVIEDNPGNLELMTYLLASFGHEVSAAGDGGEGLEAVRREAPDLIVCDVHLPKVDGYQVARQLKVECGVKHIPLIAVTALAMVGDRDKLLSAGFDGYISKPIDPETFVPEVDRFLRAGQPGARPARPSATAGEVPESPRVSRATILVVDNLETNRDLLKSLLEHHGFRVATAEGYRAGLAALTDLHPDLVLCDLFMGDGIGYDLVSAIKNDARLRVIPVILITSTVHDEKSRAEGLARGAARFIFRPVEPEVLLDEIEACLREHGTP
jgi:two-component system cell cycle response regulator